MAMVCTQVTEWQGVSKPIEDWEESTRIARSHTRTTGDGKQPRRDQRNSSKYLCNERRRLPLLLDALALRVVRDTGAEFGAGYSKFAQCCPRYCPGVLVKIDLSHNSLILLVPDERFELPTNGLQNRCSTAELIRHFNNLARDSG